MRQLTNLSKIVSIMPMVQGLKRIIQKQIETKISNNILNNHYLSKNEINIYLVNGEIIVD